MHCRCVNVHVCSALYCIFLDPQPFGIQCPLTSSLVSRLLGLAQVSRATARVGVHRLFPRDFHISVFFHSLFTCHWISFVFLIYDRRICTHPIDPSVPSLADGKYPGLGLALVPDVVVPEAKHGVRISRNLISNCCHCRCLNLGPRSLMAANVTTRLRRTPSANRVYNSCEERNN